MSGAPQGLILDPLLFPIFINDLPSSIPVKMCIHADDGVLYHTIKSPHDQIILSDSFASVQS